MGSQLPDGSIIPHNFNTQPSNSQNTGYRNSINEYILRLGTITAAYSPSDKKNLNKRVWEYDISVDQKDPGGNSTPIPYNNAKIWSLFGSAADFITWTPRVLGPSFQNTISTTATSTTPGTNQSNDDLLFNSSVYVLCHNADRFNAVIVGSPHHPLATIQTDDGIALTFQYNGLYANIDDDGVFSIVRKGGTDAKGAPLVNDNTVGQSFTMAKDGSTTIQNGLMSQYLTLSEDDKKVLLVSDKGTEINSNGMLSVDCSDGVMLGSTASEPLVKGGTYRKREQLLFDAMEKAMGQIGANLTVTGASINAAALAIVTDTGAVPGLQAAAAALIALGNVMTTLVNTFEEFRANGDSYLSQKNFTI